MNLRYLKNLIGVLKISVHGLNTGYSICIQAMPIIFNNIIRDILPE
jgi:hypothetical protein